MSGLFKTTTPTGFSPDNKSFREILNSFLISQNFPPVNIATLKTGAKAKNFFAFINPDINVGVIENHNTNGLQP